MVLRRITEHLKAQNWFAVALDFFIVVFGVFIGLQVNNWNAARIANVEQMSLLQRLEADFFVSEPTMDSASKRLAVAAQRTRQLIEYLRASDTPPDDKDILLIVEAPCRQ